MKVTLPVEENTFIRFSVTGKPSTYRLLMYAQFFYVRNGTYSSRIADAEGRMPSLRSLFENAEEVSEEEGREISRFFSLQFQSISPVLEDRSVKQEEVEPPPHPVNIPRYYAEWEHSRERLPVGGENYEEESYTLRCLSCGKQVSLWSEEGEVGYIQHGRCECGWGAWAKVHVYENKLCDKYSWIIPADETPPPRPYKENSPDPCGRCGCKEFSLSRPQTVRVTGSSPDTGDRGHGSPSGFTTHYTTIYVAQGRCMACNLRTEFETDQEGRGIIKLFRPGMYLYG